MSTDIAPLTHAEAVALDDCEQRIERGLKTFIEVGSALAAIRDNRLYRATHGAFEDYCQARWGIRRQRANELIIAARVVDEISSTGAPEPKNEAQAVALSRVPDEQRAEVWQAAVERTGGKPTAAAVRQAVEERTAPEDHPVGEAGEGRSAGLPLAAVTAGESDASVVDGGAADELPAGPDPVAMVAAALDRFVPDLNAGTFAWRKDLHARLGPIHKLTLWIDVDDAAEFASADDVETIRQLALEFASLHRRIMAARNGNVVPLRAVQ